MFTLTQSNKKRKRSIGFRIVSGGRFAAFILLTIFSISFLSGFVLSHGEPDTATTVRYITVEIKSGDTLWGIAKENNPRETDIRKLIYEISKVNHISDGIIHPGDLILIPS